MQKIRESLLLGTLLSLWDGLCRAWFASGAYRLWSALCAATAGGLNKSVIFTFFRADWDGAFGVSRLTAPAAARVEKIRAYFGGDAAFAQKVRGSVLLSILNEDMAFAVLCLAAFAIPFLPTLVLLLLCLAAFALYALNVLLGRIDITGRAGLVGVLGTLFALCYIVSAVIGLAFPASMEALLMILGLMTAAPVAAALLRREERMNLFLTVLLLSGVLMALYGIYQYVTGVVADEAWVDTENFAYLTSRAYSTFGNPNVMGEYLIPTCCIGVAMVWKSKGALRKLFYLGMTLVLAAGLYATGSRGSMLGLAIAAMLFVLIAEHRLVPLAIAGAAAMPFVLPANLIARFAAVLTMADSSSRYRLSIYAASLDMARDYWATGIGVSAFSLVYPQYLYSASNSYHSHNLFLQVLLELGVVGFIVFLFLLLAWFQRLYRSIVYDRTPNRYLTGAVLGGLAGLLAQGMTDNLWFNYRIVLLFWLVVGIGLASVRRRQE